MKPLECDIAQACARVSTAVQLLEQSLTPSLPDATHAQQLAALDAAREWRNALSKLVYGVLVKEADDGQTG